MTIAKDRGYADPIRAGVALGLVLFGVIMLAGRGLGASGAFAATAAAAVNVVAPAGVAANPYLAQWLPTGPGGLFSEWIVVELLGVALGAWASARLAGRVRSQVETTDHESPRRRMMAAVLGGTLMGGGARLARGCTSGLGLTGGALLATGAWLFIPVAFGTAFLVAFLRRRVARVVTG